jgi:hypothetical protein
MQIEVFVYKRGNKYCLGVRPTELSCFDDPDEVQEALHNCREQISLSYSTKIEDQKDINLNYATLTDINLELKKRFDGHLLVVLDPKAPDGCERPRILWAGGQVQMRGLAYIALTNDFE